ncbi:DNA topoisomerase [Lipomyces japonicus]|uniref:DNA topoisomerase n=1 Tax=Lipomyces japonicus TaxID=56871 RepID=UPI0034CE956E
MRVLCVAEKPSIAKSVANILGGGRVDVRNTDDVYTKNYDFVFRFPPPWGEAEVVMTAVRGHLTKADFPAKFKQWSSVAPAQLFHERIVVDVHEDNKKIANNIRKEARHANFLMIWTDCDREGEHIGMEIVKIAREGNRNIQVKRARFSHLERQHIISAASNPNEMDLRQASAVDARIEIDLRLGATFTRFQTLSLKDVMPKECVLSYGSCQFPTLGFVVDRFKRVQNFRPEKFWYIDVAVEKDYVTVGFNWKRGRLFDQLAVTLLLERCLESGNEGRIVSVIRKPTSKWRPLPLTTVELQRRGALFLGMSPQRIMKVAEDLYTAGFISYPRTETDQFADATDLAALIQKQKDSSDWGQYAQGLTDGGKFRMPRKGKHDDQAHPPIHPVAYVAPAALDVEKKKVYELVTRHFLACCSDDAKGESTEVALDWGGEKFTAAGLRVVERNYLDVYRYDFWESSQPLPEFNQGELVQLARSTVESGTTTSPSYLTEPELIQLMDANGIGTDATMADHIQTIQDRQYVIKVPKGAAGRFRQPLDVNWDMLTLRSRDSGRAAASRGRGSSARGGARGGRGRGKEGSRVAAAGEGGKGGVMELIPTRLGIALTEGYDEIGFDKSLTKPFLRKDLEVMMNDICEGRKTKQEVIRDSVVMYSDVFERANAQLHVLRRSCRQYLT